MSPTDDVTNADLFLWALYELGGAHDFIDVEHVFLRSFELAPRRLSWRTRLDLPDYKKCSKGLRDAEARRPNLLLKTPDGFKRQLTVEGQEWVEKNEDRLRERLTSPQPIPEPRQRPRARELAALERSDVYRQWRDDGTVADQKWRMADLLRCAPDSPRQLWRDRLETLRASARAAGLTDITHFLDAVADEHSDWFSGGQE